MTYGAKPYYREESFNQVEYHTGQIPLVSDPITVKQGEVRLAGTVMGKITATGKYIKSVRTAVDGSEVPAVILGVDVDATAGDKASFGHVHGQFIWEGLAVDASWTYAQLKAALAGSTIFLVHGIMPTDE